MDFRAWFLWATDISQYVRALIVRATTETIVDRPSEVTGFVVTQGSMGTVLTWNPAANAASYRVFRVVTNTRAVPVDFNSATLVSEVFGATAAHYFDDQPALPSDSPDSNFIFYWIQAVNSVHVGGPLSGPVLIIYDAQVSVEQINQVTSAINVNSLEDGAIDWRWVADGDNSILLRLLSNSSEIGGFHYDAANDRFTVGFRQTGGYSPGVNTGITITSNGTTFGFGTLSPNTSSILDLTSTNGALLNPRMTTTQRDALTAANGMQIYNTTANEMQGYINGSWAAM